MKTPQNVITAAQAAQSKWRVPASVSIAQWALESGWGAHAPGNNPFGIKAMPGYARQTFATHEVVHGHLVACQQTFAAFANVGEAFDCHAKLLASAPVYAAAMKDLPDLQSFVTAMGAHYATDPMYAGKIMSIIKGDALAQYDRVAP
jgi:flagellum-specific peptidoglycan hydrolase FlgJ